MMRIKYIKSGDNYRAQFKDPFMIPVFASIHKIEQKYQIAVGQIDGKIIRKELVSLQNAKREVRRILKEEFEVNLQDEIRNILCI